MIRLTSALLLLTVAAASADQVTSFRYKRSVTVQGTGVACVVLDPAIYGHAAPSLEDLRFFGRDGELPFLLALSGTAQVGDEKARVLNPSLHGRSLAFDLAMPSRAYTDVILDISGTGFLALAEVSASGQAAGKETKIGRAQASRSLGSYAVFDMTAQQLSRDTTLHLQETDRPVLHVVLAVLPGSPLIQPQMVHGAIVPPSRQAQTLYTTALSSSSFVQRSHETVAQIAVPARLPIERISFALAPSFSENFSREVRITARAQEQSSVGERLEGVIQRVHLQRGEAHIAVDRLSLPATLGANLDKPAVVEIAIENGSQPALPLQFVALETRRRQACFAAPVSSSLAMYYGDPGLEAPQYEATASLLSTAQPAQAVLGQEQRNPAFTGRHETRPLRKRHPRLVGFTVIFAVCLLGLFARRSARRRI